MVGKIVSICIALLLTLTPFAAGADYSQQIVDARLVALADRDVLVLRGDASMPAVSSYKRLNKQSALSFLLRHLSFADTVVPSGSTTLINRVTMDEINVTGTTVTVFLADGELLDPAHFRFSQPSRGVVMLEVFPTIDDLESAGLPADADLIAPPRAPVPTPEAIPPIAAKPTATFDTDALGIPTVDLSASDSARVLGLAAATGLLDMASTAIVATENKGELSVKPAGQSIVSWAATTPPGELYLSGTTGQIADFLKRAQPEVIAQQPTFMQFWQANQPSKRSYPSLGTGTSVATRQRVKDDPYAGLYYASTSPDRSVLSNVRVTLPAMNGVDLIDVLNYLSLISGISLIIDPYTFDEPFGGTRPPKVPEGEESSSSEPGFRPAGAFEPHSFGSGTVIGNLDNVPFDTALRIILELHGLEYVIYDTGGNSSGGSRYGKPADSGSGDRYSKPMILITSRERLEQELAGQNEIDLYQLHYADPYQITEILGNLNMLPGTDSGWYIYRGAGGGYGGGGGSSGGGGSQGGGAFSSATPDTGLFVYRGSTREPVESAVSQAVADGESVVRVLLKPEDSGMFVTGFAR